MYRSHPGIEKKLSRDLDFLQTVAKYAIRHLLLIEILLMVQCKVQGDQLNISVCLWQNKLEVTCPVYVKLYSSIRWTSTFLQGTRKTRSCLPGHPVLPGAGPDV